MEIIRLELLTSKLHEMKQFYVEKLQLPLLGEGNTHFSVAAGQTQLIISKATDNSNPFYHFAFNIPANKIKEAQEWMANRVELQIEDGQSLIHFPTWNAHSLYFTDPSGNIVEFIARHNLRNHSDGPFDQRDILYVSEIGLPVEKVLERAEALELTMGIKPWRTPNSQFTPVGDEHGLFILVPQGRVWYMSEKQAKSFPLELTIKGEVNLTIKMQQYTLRVKDIR